MKTLIRHIIKLTKMILYIFVILWSTYCNRYNTCRNNISTWRSIKLYISRWFRQISLITISKIHREMITYVIH